MESLATNIQWFNQTIMQVLCVCVVTIVAIATQRCANYFSSSLEPTEEEEDDSEESALEAPAPALADSAAPAALEDTREAPKQSRTITFGEELGPLFVPRAGFVTPDMIVLHTAN